MRDAGVALITGAGRGIGQALVCELARQGWHVWAGVRNPEKAVALREMAGKQTTGRIEILPLDVLSDKSVSEAAKQFSDGVLDVLVNNAAVFPEEGEEALEDLLLKCFAEAFDTNVIGVARVTRAFLSPLSRAKNPRIVNVSSQSGLISEKEDSRGYCYSASKAALNMLTRGMANELSLRGITTVALSPGWVKTEMGGPNAQITPEESARSLASTITKLTKDVSGQFLDRDGKPRSGGW